MLKKLTKITDVQVGDFVPLNGPLSRIPGLGKVDLIDSNNKYFSYSCGEAGFCKVLEHSLKQAVLLRKTNTCLEILAGEKAYEELTRPKEQGKEISEKLLGALARVCLKEGYECDGYNGKTPE